MSARSLLWIPGLGAALTTVATGAFAQQASDIPGVSVTAATSVLRDNNLFRLPNGVQPRQFGLNSNGRGDTIVVPSLSADATLLYSRQRFLLSGSLNRELLLDNPSYDTTDFSYRASWLWQVGNEWSGELADSQLQQRTSFADQLLTQPNRQTTHERRATVDFRPRPDRRLGLIYDQSIGSNALAIRQINDFRSTLIRAELGLDSGLGHDIVFGASSTHLDYPHEQIVALAPVENSYRQSQLDVSSLLAVSQKTQFQWRVGYAKRHHPEVQQRNFSGMVWNLELDWQPTAKIQGSLGATRDLGDAADYNRIYTISTTEFTELRYAATSKTTASIKASASRLNYKGDPRNFLTMIFGPGKYREDRYDSVKASIGWNPTERLSLRLSQDLETRNSNQPSLFQYRDWTTEADLKYTIGP